MEKEMIWRSIKKFFVSFAIAVSATVLFIGLFVSRESGLALSPFIFMIFWAISYGICSVMDEESLGEEGRKEAEIEGLRNELLNYRHTQTVPDQNNEFVSSDESVVE